MVKIDRSAIHLPPICCYFGHNAALFCSFFVVARNNVVEYLVQFLRVFTMLFAAKTRESLFLVIFAA